MQSIRNLTINMDVDYVKRNKRQLALFFDAFSKQYKENLANPLISYKIRSDQFDKLGTLWINQNVIDSRSLRLIQKIEDSYMSTSFFMFKDGKIGSRGYVYYCSAIKDNNDRKYLRLLNFADISVNLLDSIYERYGNRWEFGVYALLDDIRYKLLILDECFEGKIIEHETISKVVIMFYEYLQGNIPKPGDIKELALTLRGLFVKLAQQRPTQDIRKYKEAEHPFQNLVFRDTLIASLNGIGIGTIIGIRYGGSELPFLIGKYIPGVNIYRLRVSNYSSVEKDGLVDIKAIDFEGGVLIR